MHIGIQGVFARLGINGRNARCYAFTASNQSGPHRRGAVATSAPPIPLLPVGFELDLSQLSRQDSAGLGVTGDGRVSVGVHHDAFLFRAELAKDQTQIDQAAADLVRGLPDDAAGEDVERTGDG